MKNLYHLKSDHDREIIGDVIIDLEYVEAIKAFKNENIFLISLETNSDHHIAKFKDEVKFKNTFQEIISQMAVTYNMVNDYVVMLDKQITFNECRHH